MKKKLHEVEKIDGDGSALNLISKSIQASRLSMQDTTAFGILSQFGKSSSFENMLGNSSLGAIQAFTRSLQNVNPLIPNSALGVFSQFGKSNSFESVFGNSSLGTIQAFAKSFQSTNHLIPHSAFEALQGIGLQQARLSEQWKGIGSQFLESIAYARMEGLQLALNNITSQFAGLSIAMKDWETLDEFEGIATEVANINERVVEQEYATKQDIDDLKEIVKQLLPNTKKKSNISLKFLWLFLIIEKLWTFGEIFLAARDEMKPAAMQPATKQDLSQLSKDLFDLLKDEQKFTRVTNRDCKVYPRPRLKSVAIDVITKNTSVVVIDKNKKWVYISFTSLDDGLPQRGWILKKYLLPVKH